MFRPLYRPSSGCTFSYFKANCTINNVFCFLFFVNEILCTSTKFVFKIATVTVALKSYFEIKYINSVESCVCVISGGGYGVELGIFLFGNAGFLWFHSELVAW
jgi:hypothetical protein